MDVPNSPFTPLFASHVVLDDHTVGGCTEYVAVQVCG